MTTSCMFLLAFQVSFSVFFDSCAEAKELQGPGTWGKGQGLCGALGLATNRLYLPSDGRPELFGVHSSSLLDTAKEKGEGYVIT